MAGVILETLSTRKLVAFGVLLLLLQFSFFLIGGLVAPAPYYAQNIQATMCVDTTPADKSRFFVPFAPDNEDKCNLTIQDVLELPPGVDSSQVVFSLKMPLPKEGIHLDLSRWFQNVIGVLQPQINYVDGSVIHDESVITMDARLGYRNKWEPPNHWTEIVRSTEERKLKCFTDNPVDNAELYCEPLPLFELGHCHHDYYLLNIRVPVDDLKNINTEIGALKGFELVMIIQNGGFTKVWFSIKTFFFPLVLGLLVNYARRIKEQVRPVSLLEKTLFSLGCAMTLLNLPIEWFTLWIYMPYMLLYQDIRQGIFYSVLLSFWIIFAGEHLMDGHERNRLVMYWKHLAAVLFGCIALFVFEMCERGVQLTNPFYSIWETEAGANMAYAFVVVAGISACIYFLFLCYMLYKVVRNISAKKAALPDMSKVRRKYYTGLIYRFKFLMLATLICAALTVIFFIIGQVSESEWKWAEDNHLHYTSAFLTGVYAMWNLYVSALLVLYSPSRKYISALSTEDSGEEEEVEFSNIPSEASAIQSFAQKAAAD